MALMIVSVGEVDYRIVTVEQGQTSSAHAVRADTGERFGIEATAASVEEAQQALVRWLEWQHEHTQALETLQQAERVYHRAMAGAAFASADAVPADDARSALEQVNAAREILDQVRARRPNV